MNSAYLSPSNTARGRSMHRTLDADRGGDQIDTAFAVLRDALRPTGGLARAEDIGAWLESRGSGNLMSLAAHFGHGELFSVDWNDADWLPLFQFERHSLRVRPAIRQVIKELGDVFDGWSLATWFVTPTHCLGGRCPVDLLDTDLPGVLRAAQTDRFVATG